MRAFRFSYLYAVSGRAEKTEGKTAISAPLLPMTLALQEVVRLSKSQMHRKATLRPTVTQTSGPPRRQEMETTAAVERVMVSPYSEATVLELELSYSQGEGAFG